MSSFGQYMLQESINNVVKDVKVGDTLILDDLSSFSSNKTSVSSTQTLHKIILQNGFQQINARTISANVSRNMTSDNATAFVAIKDISKDAMRKIYKAGGSIHNLKMKLV